MRRYGTFALRRLAAVAVAGCLLAGSWSVVLSPTAQAHVLESDGDISAVLHMPPDDVPVADKTLTLELAFAAGDPEFDVSDYRIDVRLERGGKTLQTAAAAVSGSSTRNVTAGVQLHEVGAYRLAVQGKPIATGKPFELDYNIRAVRDTGGSLGGLGAAGADFWILSLSSLALLAVVGQYAIRTSRRYR